MERQHLVLSIDIGIKNLGWTMISSSHSFVENNLQNYEDLSMGFGIYNITNNLTNEASLVADRCMVVNKFFKDITAKFIIDYCIIERQVNTNTIAMELMYAITSTALCYLEKPSNLIIYDPKLKFKDLNITYNTKNKEHKKQSITYCKALLIELTNEELVEKFDTNKKQDDMADSFIQCLVWLAKNEKINLSTKNIRDMISNHLVATC